jgi:hypothetical protein
VEEETEVSLTTVSLEFISIHWTIPWVFRCQNYAIHYRCRVEFNVFPTLRYFMLRILLSPWLQGTISGLMQMFPNWSFHSKPLLLIPTGVTVVRLNAHLSLSHPIGSLWWLPTALGIKNQIIKMAHKFWHDLAFTWLSRLTFLSPALTLPLSLWYHGSS